MHWDQVTVSKGNEEMTMCGENKTKPRTMETSLRKTGSNAPGESTVFDREMEELAGGGE